MRVPLFVDQYVVPPQPDEDVVYVTAPVVIPVRFEGADLYVPADQATRELNSYATPDELIRGTP